MVGPPLGGFITTYFDWRWIFFINIPIGILGIVLVDALHSGTSRKTERPPLDVVGFVLSGVGLAALMLGLRDRRAPSPADRGLRRLRRRRDASRSSPMSCHARRTPHPLAAARPPEDPDLPGERYRRLAVPYRHRRDPVPAAADAADRLRPEPAAVRAPHLRRGGRRAVHEDAREAHPADASASARVLTVNAVIAAAFIAANGFFTPATPHWLIMMVLLVGGCFRSLQFTSLNAIAYADVSSRDMSYATSLSSVAQQLSLSIGVALGAGGARGGERRPRRGRARGRRFLARFLVVGGDLEPLRLHLRPARAERRRRDVRSRSRAREARRRFRVKGGPRAEAVLVRPCLRVRERAMDQRIIDLYDRYTHGGMNRRAFLDRLAAHRRQHRRRNRAAAAARRTTTPRPRPSRRAIRASSPR